MKLLFSLVTVLALAGATAVAADPLFADKVIVKGDGFQITQSQLDQAFTQRKAQMVALGRQVPEEARPMIEKETIDLLILKNILLKRATPADREEAKKIVDSQVALAPEGSLGQNARLLGISEEDFRKELLEQNIATLVVDREFKPKVVVTEEMSRKFYNENLARFEMPERVRAAHVLLATKSPDGEDISDEAKKAKLETARKVLERAKKGEDFAALAKEFSEDPGSKDTGGEYTFPRGQMVPEFEKTAFAMEPGQVSELVTTQFGYHIIKLHEKLPAQVQPFNEAETNIKAFLGRQELQRMLHEFTAEARKDPKLEILDDRFKS
ncbi:MAG TPA: hypothetical protein DCY13_11645 [Verrucomicrobiales bacterium]|nr:hypothetical protein [Verrucomicrobiales bacterium]